MNYLESERDYLKKLEVLNFKQDRAMRNKKLRDDKKVGEYEYDFVLILKDERDH